MRQVQAAVVPFERSQSGVMKIPPLGGNGAFHEPREVLGVVVAGRYYVERILGVGSMGVVFAARHLGLDEVVALKVIRPEVRNDPEIRARFAREVKIAVRIDSEGVTRVLDAGECPRLGPYLAMEYLQGTSLDQVLHHEGPLSPEQAVHYVVQACEALQAVHALGVVHRDVKPANLFLCRRHGIEKIKLLDFGVSKASLTGRVLGNDLALGQTSCLMGTPLYMSPEQIRGASDIDARADIWSLGMVLYELVAGRPAFSGESITQTCSRILEDASPRLPTRGNCVELQAIVDRCLQKDRCQRFADVAELAQALKAVDFRSVPVQERVTRRGLSFEWTFAALAVMTLLGAIAAMQQRSQTGFWQQLDAVVPASAD